ncbi:MAG: glycoside hydrolase family 88 protein [Trebonia sp.]
MNSLFPAWDQAGVDTGAAIAAALATIRRNIARFGDSYPDDTTRDGRYFPRPAGNGIPEGGNQGWTTSFWPGMQWLAWELSGEDEFRGAAVAHAADFARRVANGRDLDTHDLGFLYTLSSVTAWQLLGIAAARDAALRAADHLMGRFLPAAGIIQAWGDLSDPVQRGRTIIDSLMNLPLLTWAGQQTGDPRYDRAVRRHAGQLSRHMLRVDNSTFHTYYWDAETGQPRFGATEQGAHDDSCWARGQAWGIYGFALTYRATGDPRLIEASRRCADYLLAHLPADLVPCWDLAYGGDSDVSRDSSAAAIAACGLLELGGLDDGAGRYRRAADDILDSLIVNYAPVPDGSSDALLLRGVYDMPKGAGVDEGTLWGDYFYLEALTRRARPDWQPYWHVPQKDWCPC